MTASATILHIGMEYDTTGDVYVYRFNSPTQASDNWDSMGDTQKATFDCIKYGRRWYTYDITDYASATIRFDNWTKKSQDVTSISGDDYYIYVSSSAVSEGIYYAGQLATPYTWDKLTCGNNIANSWDSWSKEGTRCTKVDANNFTYTITKADVTSSGESEIRFRFKHDDGVYFRGSYSFSDHYPKILPQTNATNLGIASNTTTYYYGYSNTSPQKDYYWTITLPTYDYEKIVIKLEDTSKGNAEWKISADAYITKTVSGTNKYATLGCSVPLEIVEATNVTAYPLTANASNGTITKGTAITTIPADEGALLENDTKSDQTIRAKVLASADASAANDLVAFTGGTDKLTQPGDGKTYYILGLQDSHVGFYKVNTTYGNSMGANTAYLSVVGGASSRSAFFFDDETTGIEAIDSNSETVKEGAREYYNLNGQRVMNPSKGLYIVNGKKVIMK